LQFRFREFPRIEKHHSVAASEGAMLPKKCETTGSGDLFRARLDHIITPHCIKGLNLQQPDTAGEAARGNF
jgi:hypothetical protein